MPYETNFSGFDSFLSKAHLSQHTPQLPFPSYLLGLCLRSHRKIRGAERLMAGISPAAALQPFLQGRFLRPRAMNS
jgi:hypothetical protein